VRLSPDKLLRLLAAIGAALWLAFVLQTRPAPFERSWAVALLFLAPTVLVPLALRLVARVDPEPVPARVQRALIAAQIPAVLSLAEALRRPPAAVAGAFATPWLVITLFIAAGGARRVLARGLRASLVAPELLAVDVARLLLPVGAGWTVLSCAGVRPLQFEEVIVLLTGVHFHYAGFLLPLLAALAARELPGRAARFACWSVMAGVPLVAVGITLRQLGGGSLVELAAAWITAPAGAIVAWLHLRLAARRDEPAAARVAWALAALALLMGAVFAAAYGARAFVDVHALDIPWMRVLHGTPNALGFGLLGVLAWTWRAAPHRPAAPAC
jgi:YndJ-like protein